MNDDIIYTLGKARYKIIQTKDGLIAYNVYQKDEDHSAFMLFCFLLVLLLFTAGCTSWIQYKK